MRVDHKNKMKPFEMTVICDNENQSDKVLKILSKLKVQYTTTPDMLEITFNPKKLAVMAIDYFY